MNFEKQFIYKCDQNEYISSLNKPLINMNKIFKYEKSRIKFLKKIKNNYILHAFINIYRNQSFH